MSRLFRAVLLCACSLLVSCVSATSGVPAGSGGQEIVRLAPGVRAEMLDASFWITRAKKPYRIMMTKAQIAQWNEQIMQQSMAAGDNSFFVHDLRRFDRVASSADIRKFMVRYNPAHPWYKKKDGEPYRLTADDWRALYTA
ncbi:MAG: hypothetical protein K2J14_07165, partial [Treponemataceae bacterium]|nr:hypothetical protein [Treponemataceae bacterium]